MVRCLPTPRGCAPGPAAALRGWDICFAFPGLKPGATYRRPYGLNAQGGFLGKTSFGIGITNAGEEAASTPPRAFGKTAAR